jgi:DNA repair protein RadC
MMGEHMGKDNLHSGHRERLRKRFLEEGLEAFDDHQVLELLLFYAIPRSDTNPIAHRLIKRFGGLSAVLEADSKDLATIEGMGENSAAFLSMLPQALRRYMRGKASKDSPKLNDPDKAAKYVIPLMAGRTEEVFYVLCLDAQLKVNYAALISSGTVKEAQILPRHVIEEAIRHKACSVILAHNHPSGTLKPSQSDIELTRQLMDALNHIDIKVQDHIIIAGTDFLSFSKEGLMPEI